MSFQKIILVCLAAIILGGIGGLLEVRADREAQALDSRVAKQARIEERSSASAVLISEKEALEREKEAGLADFLANYPDVESE